MNLVNIPRERNQTHKDCILWFHLCVMSQIGRSIHLKRTNLWLLETNRKWEWAVAQLSRACTGSALEWVLMAIDTTCDWLDCTFTWLVNYIRLTGVNGDIYIDWLGDQHEKSIIAFSSSFSYGVICWEDWRLVTGKWMDWTAVIRLQS